VYAIDAVPSRLAIAQKFGNVVPVNFKEQDVIKTIQKEVPGGLDGGFIAIAEWRRTHIKSVSTRPPSTSRRPFFTRSRRL